MHVTPAIATTEFLSASGCGGNARVARLAKCGGGRFSTWVDIARVDILHGFTHQFSESLALGQTLLGGQILFSARLGYSRGRKLFTFGQPNVAAVSRLPISSTYTEGVSLQAIRGRCQMGVFEPFSGSDILHALGSRTAQNSKLSFVLVGHGLFERAHVTDLIGRQGAARGNLCAGSDVQAKAFGNLLDPPMLPLLGCIHITGLVDGDFKSAKFLKGFSNALIVVSPLARVTEMPCSPLPRIAGSANVGRPIREVERVNGHLGISKANRFLSMGLSGLWTNRFATMVDSKLIRYLAKPPGFAFSNLFGSACFADGKFKLSKPSERLRESLVMMLAACGMAYVPRNAPSRIWACSDVRRTVRENKGVDGYFTHARAHSMNIIRNARFA